MLVNINRALEGITEWRIHALDLAQDPIVPNVIIAALGPTKQPKCTLAIISRGSSVETWCGEQLSATDPGRLTKPL